MNKAEIVRAFRGQIRDNKRPYLVSDDTADLYLNQAVTEASRRARLIVDSTSEVSRSGISAGDPIVAIDPRVISIRRARISWRSVPMRKFSIRDMDEQFPGWDTSSNQSTPFILVTDYQSNGGYLYPTPDRDGDLLLTVTREPLAPLVDDRDEPEIPPRTHLKLIEWMKYRAYDDDDSDLYDASKSAKALEAFEAEFGTATAAINEQYEFEHYDDVGER